MHVNTHTIYDDETYYFKMSDGQVIRYELQSDGSLLGKMSENSEQVYKAIQAYARNSLGGISVQLNVFS